jgi:putative transposase
MRSSVAATRPLQAVYLDHVRVAALAVDEQGGQPLGYPWLALAFDAFTRMVAGFHLTMAPPSRVSASLCLLHSVCDKTRWMKERGLKGSWPIAGLPEAIVTDADAFYGQRGFVRACRDQGVTALSRAPGKRAYGAFAEELLGTRFGDVPILHGCAGEEFVEQKRRADLSGAQTLDELERRIGVEIVRDYHNRRHHDLCEAPLDAWNERGSQTRFRAPKDCLKFRLSFFPEQLCELRADGIHLRGQIFWSPALASDIEAGLEKIAVKFDPRDLTRIFARRTAGRFVKVKNTSLATSPTQQDTCGVLDSCGADSRQAGASDCRRKCLASCPFAPQI